MKKPQRFRLPVQKLSVRADKAIRTRLDKAIKANEGWGAFKNPSQASVGGWGAFRNMFGDWGAFFQPKMAFATLAMAVVVLGGVWGAPQYVYHSSNITKGDSLYSWKRSLELEKLQKLQGPVQRGYYYLTLSDRRLDEAQTLINRDRKKAGLVAVASAAETKHTQISTSSAPKKLTLSTQKNPTAELVAESALFVERSLKEAQSVQDKTIAKTLTTNVKQALKQNQKQLAKLQTIQDEPTVDDIIAKIQTAYVVQERLLDQWDQQEGAVFAMKAIENMPEEMLGDEVPMAAIMMDDGGFELESTSRSFSGYNEPFDDTFEDPIFILDFDFEDYDDEWEDELPEIEEALEEYVDTLPEEFLQWQNEWEDIHEEDLEYFLPWEDEYKDERDEQWQDWADDWAEGYVNFDDTVLLQKEFELTNDLGESPSVEEVREVFETYIDPEDFEDLQIHETEEGTFDIVIPVPEGLEDIDFFEQGGTLPAYYEGHEIIDETSQYNPDLEMSEVFEEGSEFHCKEDLGGFWDEEVNECVFEDVFNEEDRNHIPFAVTEEEHAEMEIYEEQHPYDPIKDEFLHIQEDEDLEEYYEQVEPGSEDFFEDHLDLEADSTDVLEDELFDTFIESEKESFLEEEFIDPEEYVEDAFTDTEKDVFLEETHLESTREDF